MRAIPTMGVFQPMDAKETQLIMDYLVTQWKGPAYLRLTRQNLPDLYPSHRPFRPTKLMEIREPILEMKTQVLCIATGSTVSEACQAAEILKEKKVSLCVWNAHCLKPFDKETLFQIIQGYQAIASIEDHTVVGGLGSCISEALASLSKHPPLIFLGIQDAFGESGAAFELYEKFGISAKQVASQILMKLGLS
jgi:transketolase